MPNRTGRPGELVTIRGVELARTGRWATSTGVFDFTRADFEDAVRAESDPEVWAPPLKLGHTDPRFNTPDGDPRQPDGSLASLDGDPALGWIENLSVRDDGAGKATLLGDLVDVPAALASIIPSAYRRRSIELAFGVRTPSGRTYKAAVIGLALLGVQAPAVAGLADVLKIYAGDATFEVAAAAASDGVRSVLLDDGPTVEDRLSALELAAGVTAIPAPAAPAGNTGGDDPTGGSPMPMTEDRMRELLGIAETADLEAELTRLREAGTPAPGDPATPATPAAPAAPAAPTATTPPAAAPAAPAPTDPAAPAAPAAPAPVATDPAAPAAPAPADPALVAAAGAIPAGFTLVDTATASQMQALVENDRLRRREGILAAAARAGRIAPTAIVTWRDALDRDMVANAALLEGQPAVFPTFELGHAEGVDVAAASGPADDAVWDKFYEELGA